MPNFKKSFDKYINEKRDVNDPNRKRFNIPDDDDESDVDITKPLLYIKKDASEGSRIKSKLCGDCTVRAVSIATGILYAKVYRDLENLTKKLLNKKFGYGDGVNLRVTEKYLKSHGYKKVYHKPYLWAYNRSYETIMKYKFNIEDAINKYGCDDLVFQARDMSYINDERYIHTIPIKLIHGKCIVFDTWDSRYSDQGDEGQYGIYEPGEFIEVVQVFRKK